MGQTIDQAIKIQDCHHNPCIRHRVVRSKNNHVDDYDDNYVDHDRYLSCFPYR